MKRNYRGRQAACCLFALALWALPMARAIKYLSYAGQAYSETQSIDAYNDYSYGRELAFVYLVGLAATLVLVLALCRTGWLWLWGPLAAATSLTFAMIGRHPEAVVVFIPAFNPMVTAIPYIVLGLSGIFAMASFKLITRLNEPIVDTAV
jgi:hypothetical protein